MDLSFTNGILYLCVVAGIVLMFIGGIRSDRKLIKQGFVTLIVAYLGLNLNSLAQSGTLNSFIISLANYFGVTTPKMFVLDIFIGANLTYLFVNIFPFKKLSRSKGNIS